MVDILGGFLSAVGDSGAGGFKAMGEVADQNLKDKSQALRDEAIAERQANLQRLHQTWQSGETEKSQAWQSGESEKGIKANIDLQGQSQKHAEGLLGIKEKAETQRHTETLAEHRASTAATIAAQRANTEATMSQTKAIREQSHELAMQKLKAEQETLAATKAYQQEKSTLDSQYRLAQSQNERDKIADKMAETKRNAISDIQELFKRKETWDAGKGMAAEIGIPITEVETTRPSKGLLEWGDQKIKVPAIDYKAIQQGKQKGADVSKPSDSAMPGEAQPQQGGVQPTASGIDAEIARAREIAAKRQQTKPELGSSPQPTGQTSQLPGTGLLSPSGKGSIPKLDRAGLSEILNKSDESQTGPYKSSYEPGNSPSIFTGIQKIASKTQGSESPKFGEGDLEFAIRTAGFGDDLAILKDYANNLRKEFPKLSDTELAKLVMNATEPNDIQ